MNSINNLIRGKIKTRFYLDKIQTIDSKLEFAIKVITLINESENYVILLKFWQDQSDIISSFPITKINRNYEVIQKYAGHEAPGLMKFIVEDDYDFCKNVLLHHFNYETGGTPFLNIRPLIILNDKKLILDIYDDRGFDLYV